MTRLLFLQWLRGKAISGMERILCRILCKKIQESIDRCMGRQDIYEIKLKTALNAIQFFNEPTASSNHKTQ